MKRRKILLALAAATATGATLSAALTSATNTTFGSARYWPFAMKTGHQPLLIAGSGTMYALNRALADAFAQLHPECDLVVEKGGSLPALIALKRGAIDIAAMEHDMTASEEESHLRNFLIARNDIGIAVNKKSPIALLSTDQIRGLLSGDIGNWKHVGGPDAAVQVISRQRGSTSRHFIEEVVLAGGDIAPEAIEVANTRQLAERVAANPHAIGYISLKDRVGIGEVAYLAVDGVAASRETILSNRYPFTQSLYLVVLGDQPGPATEFIAFARSAAGQQIIGQQRLVSAY
jgi:phosphate transport system substrate-binding protein